MESPVRTTRRGSSALRSIGVGCESTVDPDGAPVVVGATSVVVGCLTERARESGSPGPSCHLSSTPSSSASTQSVLVMESSGRSIHMPYPVLAVSALEVVEERVAVGAAVVVGNGIVDAGAD